MPTDPTLDSLRRFEDPSLWEVFENVPVFDEHDETQEVEQQGHDGRPRTVTQVVRFDRRRLEQIAANCNAREARTGDVAPVTVGHTHKGTDETQQPPIVGYARRYTVGPFGPQGKLAVAATFFMRKNQRLVTDKAGRPLTPSEILSEYPRRSVELWPEDILDPIALLRRTPQRDLGITTYQRTSPRRVYQMPDMPGAMPGSQQTVPAGAVQTDSRDEQLLEKFFKHPLMQHLAKKYGAECGVDPGNPMSKQKPTPPAPAPSQYGAGGPSGSNTFTPGPTPSGGGDGQPPGATVPPVGRTEAARMQRDQEAIHYARLEQENAALKQRLDAVEATNRETAKQYLRERREKDLIQLEAEGYQFDRAQELDDVTELSQERYVKHLEKIRRRYQRMPVPGPGRGFVPTAPLRDAEQARSGPAKSYSREQSRAAIELCESDPDLRKMPWQAAYDAALERVAKVA